MMACRGQCGDYSEHHGRAVLMHHLPGHVQHDVSHAHPWLRALSHVQVSTQLPSYLSQRTWCLTCTPDSFLGMSAQPG